MNETEPNSDSPQPVPRAEHLRALTVRAENAGYVLLRGAAPHHEWQLVDGEYGEVIVAATELDRIEQWLDT